MVSMEIEQERESAEHATCKSPDNTITSPRISFSCDLSDDASFISINLEPIKTEDDNDAKQSTGNFEFLQADNRTQQREMPTADELFFEGKLLPYWQTHDQSEKLRNLSLKSEKMEETAAAKGAEEAESRVRTWFIDDDPSPRPPKCTVLWKELLRLKSRQKGSTLSPSSSSSSSSSSTNSLDMSKEKEKEKSRESNGGISNGKNNNVKRVKKGLERTRSASIRIRPMVNVPICTHSAKQSSLPPLFPMRRGAR